MFYKDVVPLDPAKHADLRLTLAQNYVFAQTVHAVPVVGGEFGSLMREYPIVFAETGEKTYMPTAMVGLRADQNVFVDADGKWDAQYIPFFVRRYPYVTVEVENNDAVLCIEESVASAIQRDTDPLAFVNGQPSEELKQFAGLMFRARDEANQAKEFAAELAKHDLMRQVSATATLANGEEVGMDGMWVIDEEKLRALPAETLGKWTANGMMSLIYSHIFSLGNIDKLAKRIA
ncbi:SapC family protein [Chitinimonas sp. BJYL2]|uniref:SapC family protein n=1 Tax=Chitinimonas sp. BJYL2 TaxID=2976696 RepID=UPI0022B3E1F4|nr:SapC family protein [Chitinimonas sp. BJYL2]